MKTNQLLTTVLLLSIALLTSCKVTNTSRETDIIEGVYKSVGYGRILKIENGDFILADVTSLSCVALMAGHVSDFDEYLSYANDTMSIKSGINTYLYTRIDDAPQVCKKGSIAYKEAEEKAKDPERNFEILWETFKDHYAYFELRNINPDKMYATYRPQVTPETTDAELFFVLTEMLDSFDDGHIDLSAPDDVEAAAKIIAEQKYLATNVSEENKRDTLKKLNNFKVAEMVANKYIPYGKTTNAGVIRYGILKDTIGYLQMNLMMGVADYGIDDALPLRDYFNAYFELVEESNNETHDNLVGLNKTLDAVMIEFKETKAVIIDVRFNGGGHDEVGMDVLKRFNKEEKIVFTKKGKMGDGFTPTNSVRQPASKEFYKQPVYLLISAESASATEIMSLSSLSMPNITKIGSRTEGVFSDVLDKELPNGWDFGLSSEVYLDMDGTNYESMGISPDIEIDYSRDTQTFLNKVIKDLNESGDAAIEMACKMINK